MKFKLQTHIFRHLLLFITYCISLTMYGCGYHMVGSTSLPFRTVVINPVVNETHEPGLDDLMHSALSREFIKQGINVTSRVTEEDNPQLETAIRFFQVNTIAVSDNRVTEQSITMVVDFKFIENKMVIELNSITSPINITFSTGGGITEAIVERQRALERLSSEIAKELISRLAMRYAK